MSEQINTTTGEVVETSAPVTQVVKVGPLRTSPEVGALYGALAKAQGEFGVPHKNSTVDFTFNGQRTFYKYADLTECLKVTTPALAKNGICMMQMPTQDANGIHVTTHLAHSSGQYLQTTLSMPTGNKSNPKDVAANFTYAKRYAVCALLNISADADPDASDTVDTDKKGKTDNKSNQGVKSNTSNKRNSGNKSNTGNTEQPVAVEGDSKLIANIKNAKTVVQVQGYLRQATNKHDTAAMQAANDRIQQMGTH